MGKEVECCGSLALEGLRSVVPGFELPFPAQRSQQSLKKEHFILALMRPSLKLLEVLLLPLKVRLPLH